MNKPMFQETQEFIPVLDHLRQERGLDFSRYRLDMIQNRIRGRLEKSHCPDVDDYLIRLKSDPNEIDCLLDALTINVSRFFRDTLTFEYLADIVLPNLAMEKAKSGMNSLRIWSTGCAYGEEPYSIAILIKETLQMEDIPLNLNIFATDVNKGAIGKGVDGIYPFESVENMKYGLLRKYFINKGDYYHLNSEIKSMVNFSVYDMLDSKTYAPPESVFGHFDMVFCCNLLIYMEPKEQELVFAKIHRSLGRKGYLVLGHAEVPIAKYEWAFRRVNACCHVYRKTQ